MLTHDLADYAVAERDRALPDEAIHWAKRAVIDWCATTAPGAIEMPATGMVKALAEDIGRGKARLFPSGTPATMRTAAVINAAASHTVEFDDIFRDALFHAGTPTVSTALAAAENEDLSGDDFLRCVIVGYEIGTRIAVVMGREHYKFWHNTATNGSFSAAAAAGTAFRLDRDQFANALGIAGTMAAGLQQTFRSDNQAKPLHGTHAADSGLIAAQSAKQGITGALDILEGEVGYGAAMSKDCDWSQVTDGLGERYNIARMTTKNHGCCGHAFAAIDGAIALRDQHGLTAADIKHVRVGGYSATVDICSGKSHKTPVEGRFSVPYLVANGITYGNARLDAFTEARLNDPVSSELAPKVDVYLDEDIDSGFPHRRAARVTIETNDGRTLEHYQPTRIGDPDAPLSDDQLAEKYNELVIPVIGERAAAQLLDACWSLDSLGSVRDLPIRGRVAAAATA
jgi:2-methylcitrate dehydratase PrpD